MNKNEQYMVVGKLTGIIENLKNYISLLDDIKSTLIYNIENDIPNDDSLTKLLTYMSECQLDLLNDKNNLFL